MRALERPGMRRCAAPVELSYSERGSSEMDFQNDAQHEQRERGTSSMAVG